MSRFQVACLFALLGVCAGACKERPDPMQTIVLIDADAHVREALAGEVYVSRAADNALLHTVTLPPREWPIKFVLAPQDRDAQRRFSVTFSSSGDVPFGFELTAGFVTGRTRTLHVQIADSCVETDSACRLACGAIDVSTERMRASAELSVPITCTEGSDAQTNMTDGASGAGGAAADGGENIAGMISVGARAGAGASTGGGRAPAAGSGGTAGPVGGQGAPPSTSGGQSPAPGACAGDPCGAHGECAADGSCACDPGYVSAGMGKACEDVDECQGTPKPCNGGKCQNLEGDFSCECDGATWSKPDAHSCGRFDPPEALTPKYSSAVPCQPQVAFYGAADQPGKGLAIWITGDSTQSLWSASYDAASGWTLATLPITLGVSGLDSPRLALNAMTGDGFAIWLQNGTDTSEIRYALRRNGRFGAPVSLTTVESGQASSLSAALSANGDGYATWTEADTSTGTWRSQVMVARFLGRTTQTWSGKTAIAGADGMSNAALSRVAVDGQGRATIVWSAAPIVDGGTPSFIGKSYVARYDPSATSARGWVSGALDQLASGLPDVSFEPGGKGVSVWQRQALSGGITVAASRYVPGSDWAAPGVISNTSDYAFMLPRVAVMPSGAALALWLQQSAGAMNVSGSLLDGSSGKWIAPAVTLSPQASTPPAFDGTWGELYFDLIDVAVDAAGGGVGVFSDFMGTSRVIRAVHAREGAAEFVGPIEITRDTTPIRPSQVEVGLDAQGAGALIWDQPLSAMPPTYQVFVSRIE